MTAVTTRGPVAVYPSKSNASRSSVSTGEMHAATPDISEGVVKPEPPVSAGGSENDSDDTNGWSNYKAMNKKSLAEVALLTESEAAKMFRMGTTRFKARCRDLGISRWPHRKLMSLKNLYSDLVKHLQHAHDTRNKEQCKRVRGMMLEIKSYAQLLEADLSRLNQFYNGKKAWPENILKIRQTIYKKRHAQVLMDKKNAPASGLKQENSDTVNTTSKASSVSSYEMTETNAPVGLESKPAADATFGLRAVGQNLEAHWAEDEDMWLFLARGQ